LIDGLQMHGQIYRPNSRKKEILNAQIKKYFPLAKD